MVKQKRELSGYQMDKKVKQFRIFEICTFVFELVIISSFLITDFTYIGLGDTSLATVLDMAILLVSDLILIAGLTTSVIGYVKDNFFLNKWGMLLLFLAAVVSEVMYLSKDIIIKGDYFSDIIGLAASLLVLILIVKEMISLYAEKIVKSLYIGSLVFLCLILALMAGIILFIVIGLIADPSTWVTLVELLMYSLGTLAVPSITFFLYPGAIQADYSIQDDKARKEAILGE